LAGDSERESRQQYRARVRKQCAEEVEEDCLISGRRPERRARREEVTKKVKAYHAAHRRNNAQFRRQTEEEMRRRVSGKFCGALKEHVTGVLGRPDGARRNPKDRTRVEEFCGECGSHLRSDFHRDGYWPRSLQTRWGTLDLQVPRVRCVCGGTVSIAFPQFAPWERRFEDVQEEILGLNALCLSLRQIRVVLDMEGTRLSIATLASEIGKVADLCTVELSGKCAAPVVRLDAIWGYLAEETGEEFVSKRQQKRKRKKVSKVPLLVAWGVWPDSGKKALLGWVVGKKEDTAAWQKLLETLHERGIHANSGLRLIVSDGSSGLEAALGIVSFGRVAHQRCVFHKMRNVLGKVKGEPVEGDRKAKRAARKKRREEVLADLVPIWQAESAGEARQRYEAFLAKWEAKEPEAAACLRDRFEATLAFYWVQAQVRAKGQEWDARHLRTTSGLERVNRNIRVKLRAATMFQSEAGLYANVYLALGARGKNQPGEFREWVASVVMALEELERAA